MNPDPLELEIARHRPRPVSQRLRQRIEDSLNRPAVEPSRQVRAARMWWLAGSLAAAAALVFAVRTWAPFETTNPIVEPGPVEPHVGNRAVEPTPVRTAAPTGPTLWACRQAASRSDSDLDSLLAAHSPRVFAGSSNAPRVGTRDLQN